MTEPLRGEEHEREDVFDVHSEVEGDAFSGKKGKAAHSR